MGAIEQLPGIPPAAASHIAAKLLNRHSPRQIADAIEVLMDVLDVLDGDPDAEETDAEDSFALPHTALHFTSGPGCNVSDCGENAWIEWHTMRGAQKGGPNIVDMHEDYEDDDPAENDDEAEEDDPSGQCDEDGVNTGSPEYSLHGRRDAGPGCQISDPGGCEWGGLS